MDGAKAGSGLLDPWAELAPLSRDESAERPFLQRLLELWCAAHGAAGAALYVRKGGSLDLELAVGGRDFPDEVAEDAAPPPGLGRLALPGGALLVVPAEALAKLAGDEPLTLLLASEARSCQLRRQL